MAGSVSEERAVNDNSPQRANSQLVVFELDAQRFALPLQVVERVERVVALTQLAEAPAAVAGVIDVRGALFPVIALRECWNLPPRPLALSDQLLLARGSRRAYALLVDSVLDVADYDPTTIVATEALAGGADSLCGALRLNDGIVFIHDLDHFLSLDAESALAVALEHVR